MKQITLIAASQDGLVAGVSKALAEAGVNMESFDAMDVQDRAVVTMTVDRYDEALLALRNAGYDAYSDDATIINIQDVPGALARVTQRLLEGGVKVRSIRSLNRQQGQTLVAVAMDDATKGLDLIRDLIIDVLP